MEFVLLKSTLNLQCPHARLDVTLLNLGEVGSHRVNGIGGAQNVEEGFPSAVDGALELALPGNNLRRQCNLLRFQKELLGVRSADFRHVKALIQALHALKRSI